jgi:zinc transport system substrate-binding protein
MQQRVVWMLSWLALAAVLACGPGERAEEAGRADPGADRPLTVYVVNYPLQYVAERIGGEHVRVVLPAPADVDPAYWSPDAETVAAYQAADLILLNGAGYARWVERVSLPRTRLVDTSAAFRDRLIARDAATTHIHGPEGAHTHAELAFTTWLDPELAILQARAVAEAFSEARPEHEGVFGRGLSALESALGELDTKLGETARAIGETPLLFSHPVYQYFERRYGLNSRSLHWEPDAPPDESAWRALEELLVEHPARWMIWEAAPADPTVRKLEAMGVRSIVYSPCANTTQGGDFLGVMHRNAAALEALRRRRRSTSDAETKTRHDPVWKRALE